MALINLKKGLDLPLEGKVVGQDAIIVESKTVAISPEDFYGLVPRLDVKEGDAVRAGEKLFHDKQYPEVAVTSPISGTVKEIVRGERRKILAILVEGNGAGDKKVFDVKSDVKSVLMESGLWACMLQRPYAIVPHPDVEPRDIFVTAFDSAPLAPDFEVLLKGKEQFIQKGIDVLASLTKGKVYVGTRPNSNINVANAEVNEFAGPHPAGNVGVQIGNVKPVNKGEVVWTLDIVTVARIGELFTTGSMSYDTVVAVTGSEVVTPKYVKCVIGTPIADLLNGNLKQEECKERILSGNVLTGYKTDMAGYLRFPYRQITVIPENSHPAEFMGWASLSPKKFSIYRSFFSWLLGKRPVALDAKMNGGERAIVLSGEYDRMLPMDIYAEFLIKAVIGEDIDSMEQLGIYEVAPEDFALCEYADTSKLELQKIIREGLDKLRKEME